MGSVAPPTDLELPTDYLGLRTPSTRENVENLVTTHETAEASQLLVKVRLVKNTGRGTRKTG